MYYEQEMSQADIADRLSLSQSSVSRFLKRAKAEHLVRIIVTDPHGTYSYLEQSLQEAFELDNAVVVDSGETDDQLVQNIGAAAAFYVETTLRPGEIIGLSSWSGTLLAMVDAIHPRQLRHRGHAEVVQILGGVGNPRAEVHAVHLTRRLAELVDGPAHFLPAPGIAGSRQARDTLLEDPYVDETMKLFHGVTLALVGIGSLEPSHLLAASGNRFSPAELDSLKRLGAVGDICSHFFDNQGRQVISPQDERVIGMSLEELKLVPRSVGIAGGLRKREAIRGALNGRLINVLITDNIVAERLVAERLDHMVRPLRIANQAPT
ncbi:MAG: sugar-binding transcriptional regulator [Gaiellaceae bacterium]|jgi:DNA-binding transcriptional regulator LsrR (DeoR family)